MCIGLKVITYFICYIVGEFVSMLTQLIPGDNFLITPCMLDKGLKCMTTTSSPVTAFVIVFVAKAPNVVTQ